MKEGSAPPSTLYAQSLVRNGSSRAHRYSLANIQRPTAPAGCLVQPDTFDHMVLYPLHHTDGTSFHPQLPETFLQLQIDKRLQNGVVSNYTMCSSFFVDLPPPRGPLPILYSA